MSSVSKETALRADHPANTPVIDPATQQAKLVLPSDVAPPTQVNTLPQQASTQPGDGSEVDTDGHRQRSDTDEVLRKTQKVPFKEQVIGVAQKTRGTLLSKPDLKEHGEAILDGRTTHEHDRNQ